jgi:predicted nucleotidyltransferase component of viral defense system
MLQFKTSDKLSVVNLEDAMEKLTSLMQKETIQKDLYEKFHYLSPERN